MAQVRSAVRKQLRGALADLPDGPLPHLLLPVQAEAGSTAQRGVGGSETRSAGQAAAGLTVSASACRVSSERAGPVWDPWAEPGSVTWA